MSVCMSTDSLRVFSALTGDVHVPDRSRSAGRTDPPTRHPGTRHPGTRHPGTRHPGTRHPGTRHPGTRHPGTRHPGTRHPGTRHPGTRHPGTRHPGTRHPGTRHPGTRHVHLCTQRVPDNYPGSTRHLHDNYPASSSRTKGAAADYACTSCSLSWHVLSKTPLLMSATETDFTIVTHAMFTTYIWILTSCVSVLKIGQVFALFSRLSQQRLAK